MAILPWERGVLNHGKIIVLYGLEEKLVCFYKTEIRKKKTQNDCN